MTQKALAGGVPIGAAISSPSSHAAEFARDSGQTLIGFLRGERMNIYAGANRVNPSGHQKPNDESSTCRRKFDATQDARRA